jgi:hypothetical protein
MFKHATNIPYIRDWFIFMDQFSSIAHGSTELVERLVERMRAYCERSQMVLVELGAFIDHFV